MADTGKKIITMTVYGNMPDDAIQTLEGFSVVFSRYGYGVEVKPIHAQTIADFGEMISIVIDLGDLVITERTKGMLGSIAALIQTGGYPALVHFVSQTTAPVDLNLDPFAKS